MKGRTSLEINIPNPCTQAWNDMAPVENGKFCQHCRKKVTDYSAMTDQELIKTLSSNEGNSCGRFLPEQLGRMLNKQAKQKRSFFPAAIFASMVAAIIPESSNAQKRTDTTALTMVQKAYYTGNKPIELEGRIVDSLTNEGLPHVTIAMKQKPWGTVSNADGNFRLRLPYGISEQTIALRISYLGFNEKEISFHLSSMPEPLTIGLQKVRTDLDEVVVTGYGIKTKRFVLGGMTTGIYVQCNHHPTWWQRITKAFRKKHECAK